MSKTPLEHCTLECARTLRSYREGFWLCDKHTEVEGFRVPVLWEDGERLKALRVLAKRERV